MGIRRRAFTSASVTRRDFCNFRRSLIDLSNTAPAHRRPNNHPTPNATLNAREIGTTISWNARSRVVMPGFNAAKTVASSSPRNMTAMNTMLRAISEYHEAQPVAGAAMLRIVIQLRSRCRRKLTALILDRKVSIRVDAIAQFLARLKMRYKFTGQSNGPAGLRITPHTRRTKVGGAV